MKTTLSLFLFLVLSCSATLPSTAGMTNKEKSNKNNAERKRDYDEAVNALKSQNFLMSFYAVVDRVGDLTALEPEGNFLLVNKDNYTLQKSVSMVSLTFPGFGSFKGAFADYKLKISKKGSVEVSFVLKLDTKKIQFKGKMNQGDNVIVGAMKGKIEEQEIVLSGNIQPVQSHFVY